MRGKLDLAFLRPETDVSGLIFKTIAKEPLVVVMPSDHRLATRERVTVSDLVAETFINVSNTAPVLRRVIDGYLKNSAVALTTVHEVDNLAMAMSLVASTRGVALLPAYAQNFLPWSVISRPLQGDIPTIDLAIGYRTTNSSAVLKLFLAKADELTARVAQQAR
jgi:LysR family hca operon transcriptional activator